MGAKTAVRDPRLVGRNAELATVASALAARPCVVLISGEPGIGKTRLMAAAEAAAEQSRNALVLRGYASESGGGTPFFPLVRALRPILEHIRDGASGVAPQTISVLAAAGFMSDPAVPPPPPLGPEAERLRLFDTIEGVLKAEAEGRPVVVSLDDLQWADPATLNALKHLHRALDRSDIAFLLAARAEAFSQPGHPLPSAVSEFSRHRALLHVQLKPLEQGDVAALAEGALGADVDSDLAQRVADRSGGNPFFVEELLRDMKETGAISRNGDIWQLAPGPGAGGDRRLPLTLRLTIAQRVERLPADTQAALNAAATFGRAFTLRLLADALGWDRQRVAGTLTAARAAGLITETEGGWTFVHDTIQEAIAATPDAVTPALHAAAARALRATAGAAPDAGQLADIASHLGAAGEYEDAAETAVAASRAALAMHAPLDALKHARLAVSWAKRMGVTPVEARLAHADAALACGEFPEAEEQLRGVLAIAKSSDHDVLGRAWALLGVLFKRREMPGEAVACFSSALESLEQATGNEEAQADVLIELAELEGLTIGRYADAEAHGSRALETARRRRDTARQARALLVLANARGRARSPVAMRPLLIEALAQAASIAQQALSADICGALSISYYWTGEMQEARRYALRRFEEARRSGDVFGMRHAHSWLALVEVQLGNWSEAVRLLDEAAPTLALLDNPEPAAFVTMVRSFVAYYMGDLETAIAMFREAMHTFESIAPATAAWYGGVLGFMYADMGLSDEARAYLERQRELYVALGRSSRPAQSSMMMAGMTYVMLGDHERARECEEVLSDHPDDYHWWQMRQTLTALAAMRGDMALAMSHITVAEAQARREKLWPSLVMNLLQRARLLQPGDPAKAAALQEAEDLAARLGMKRYVEKARALRSSGRAQAPGGLTSRELEVLRLVAQGKTNREIAQGLTITERTVINHLSSIFSKLGLTNRAAATAYAHQHGLV